jgi:hypothetical protein
MFADIPGFRNIAVLLANMYALSTIELIRNSLVPGAQLCMGLVFLIDGSCF